MLVLGRIHGEAIVITDPVSGTKIRIVVVDIRYGRARIGIDAPRDWRVMREEIEDLPAEEQRNRRFWKWQ